MSRNTRRKPDDLKLRGPIVPLPRERTESRLDQRLPLFWEREQDVGFAADDVAARYDLGATGGQARLVFLADGRGAPWQEVVEQQGVVFVILANGAPDEAAEAALAAADHGARVYVLATPGFGEGQQDPGLRERSGARVLVRRARGLPASAVIGGRGEVAGLWLHDPGEGSTCWWMSLSGDQGGALFRAALHLFWHEAEDEAWTTDKPLAFGTPGGRPFDAPRPGPSTPIRLFDSDHPPGALRGWPVVHDPGGSWCPDGEGDGAPNLLVRPPDGAVSRLGELVGPDTSVVWDELSLPALGLGEELGLIRLSCGGPWALDLRLDRDQARELYGLFELVADLAPWHLRRDTALGDVQGDVLLEGEENAAPLVSAQHIDEGKVQAEALEDMERRTPREWSTPDVRALSVVHTWQVEPPRAPSKARVESLPSDWSAVDRALRDRVDQGRRALDAVESKRKTLGERFKALAGSLLGFERSETELSGRLKALSEATPSRCGTEGARELFEELEAVEGEIDSLVGELEQEEEQQRRREEEDEQWREWQQGQDGVRKEISNLEVKLNELQDELSRIDKELSELSGQPRPKGKEGRQYEAEVTAKRARQIQLSEAIEQRKREVNALRARLDREFQYRPTRKPQGTGGKKGGALFVPRAKDRKQVNIPDEALPSVGELLTAKGKRYLAVGRWEELEQGKAEAERLDARLVAAHSSKEKGR